MAKLERKNVKVFASNPNDATQVSAFLTGKKETPDYSSDPDIIQNIYYTKGWLGDGENDLPQVTDMNGVMYSESYKTAYLYQQGIADWIVTQEYAENSFCQVAGVLYKSLVDNNIGNDPTTDDGTHWLEIVFDPYIGENLGNAEGIYAGKTSNNELQFKGIAVTGNGNISASDDTITISIGGGGTGDVYWGAIDGILSNQSDLQQALNLKQNLIGYTPEDVSNKVTTVRTDTVATDTAYPSEKATRTAIDNAITTANTYTDNALTNLNSDAFVLYANSWDSVMGTLTTVPPTGTGSGVSFTRTTSSSFITFAKFNYLTTAQTTFNNTFTYDILIPLRNADIREYAFRIILTIEHQDVNGGTPTTLIDYETNKFIPAPTNRLNIEIRQDNLNLNAVTYPEGAEIKFDMRVKSEGSGTYEFDLLVYDQDLPLVISRNRSVNKNLVTAFNTQVTGTLQNQEYLNYLLYNNKQNKINGFDFVYSSTTPYEASIMPVDGTISTNIGSNSYPITNLTANNITGGNVYTNKLIAYDASTGYIEFQANQNKYRCESGKTHNFVMGTDTIASIGYIDSNNNGLRMSGPIFASANSTYNIGSGGFRFKNLYVGFIGDGSHYTDVAYVSQIWTDSIVAKPTSYGITLKNDLIGDSLTAASLGTTTYPISGLNVNTAKINTSLTIPRIIGNSQTPNAGSLLLEGRLYIYNGSTEVIQFGFSQCLPSSNKVYNLGGNNNSFNGVFGANFVNTSDIRLKDNIVEYTDNALDKISSLTPIKYNFKDEPKENIKLGLSAQEVKEQEPLCVNCGESDEDFLGIDIYALNTLCLKAIKELKEKVDYLELRIEELEKGNKKELEK